MTAREIEERAMSDARAAMPAKDKPRAAQEYWRAHPELTGAELADEFGMKERWGRNQIKAARNGTNSERRPARVNANGTPAKTNGTVPARPPRAGRAAQHRAGERAAWVGRATTAGIVFGLIAVVGPPWVVSFHSLTGWGRDALEMGELAWVVPFTLDAAALTCVLLTFHAMWNADSAGAARLLVWVFAFASAVANWRHGTTVSADAAVYYAAMPLVAALLLDIALRRARRHRLADIGALEPALPRYRAARWMVAPFETFRGWRYAVRQRITDPGEAIEAARAARTTCNAGTDRINATNGTATADAGEAG